MEPTNLKAWNHRISDFSEKLSNHEITVDEAIGQAKLAARFSQNYLIENQRTQVEMAVDEYNRIHGTKIKLRNLDGKPFDDVEDSPLV